VAQKFKTAISVEELSAASAQAVGVKVDGDSEARVKIDAGGKITWGSGSAAGDVNLYRSAANTLKTDDAVDASAAGVVNLITDGEPTGAAANGTIAIDTTNNKFYFRSSGAWQEIALDTLSATAADGGSSASWVRFHINADGQDSVVNV
jgi:hypothetical protein|tara:strand:+ start:337 stop:783 length:447 start_codon:yes stop_codon:yes gene_type:complete